MLAFTTISSYAQLNYPATKTTDSSSTYWGVTYKDPYRWLENLKSPEVDKWFKDQSTLTNSVLDSLNGRDELIAEYRKLNKLQPERIKFPCFEGGRLFYCKIIPGDNVAKMYYREGMNGKETMLFNPTTYIKDTTLSILSILPSYDGKKIAIHYSANGAELSTLKIMDVDTKSFLPETIYPSWATCCSWSFDNKSIVYTVFKSGDNTSMDMAQNAQVKLHIIGKDITSDKDILSNQSYPALNIKPNEVPVLFFNKDANKYMFGELMNVRQELFTYYASISELNSDKINWKLLCNPEDGIVKGR